MNKTFWRAALIRAIKTIAQTLSATIPAGVVVTPVMIEQLDWKVVYIVIAWLATGLLGGIASILTSIATGLPEVEAGELLGSGMQTIYHTYPDESEPEEEREV